MKAEDCLTCTVRKAEQLSGVGRTTIYKAIGDGRLVSTKVGRRRLIILASLRQMLGVDRAETVANTREETQ
jgi:excisionase family DNA binding protein